MVITYKQFILDPHIFLICTFLQALLVGGGRNISFPSLNPELFSCTHFLHSFVVFFRHRLARQLNYFLEFFNLYLVLNSVRTLFISMCNTHKQSLLSHLFFLTFFKHSNAKQLTRAHTQICISFNIYSKPYPFDTLL